jgi:hypothetical protein
MTVKFRIGLTIDGETLFGLMAKMLPIENLSVEEVLDKTPRFDLEAQVRKLGSDKPKRQINKRPSPGPNLKKGINGLIMTELSTGPKRAVEMAPAIVAAGYSGNSVTSRLEELRKYGVLEHANDGKWKKK